MRSSRRSAHPRLARIGSVSFVAGVALTLSACAIDPLTTTSPVVPEHSVCERLFGNPLPASWAQDPESLPLMSAIGDPGYELRCIYGTPGVREFVIATTRLDTSMTRASIMADLTGRGYKIVEQTDDIVLLSSTAVVDDYVGEVDLIDASHWIRVTIVSPEGRAGHDAAVAAASLWLPEIRQAIAP